MSSDKQTEPHFDIWGMEKNALLNYLNTRALYIMNADKKDAKDMRAFFESQTAPDNFEDILKINGDTADILITGRLDNDGPDFWDYMFGWGGTSYQRIIAAADRIEENSAIQNVNLRMNTPGGVVEGVDNVWKRLMELRKSKRITAINEGMLASCGYYIASAAHEIHSTSETNESGSIGIIIVGMDWSKNHEERGIKKIFIVSQNAPDKHIEIGDKKGQKILQERVDIAEEFFLNRISAGRDVDIETITTDFGRGGLLYSATLNPETPSALSVGMIDKVINPMLAKHKSKTRGKQSVSGSQKTQKKEIMQTLQELLANSPEAKAEYDRLIKKDGDVRFEEGVTEGKKEAAKTAENVFTYMKADNPYATHAGIQAVAADVLKGEQPISNLKLAISMFDSGEEKKKSKDAKAETEKHGDTPPNHDPAAKEGKVTDEASMKTEVDVIKGLI